jgi:hypothetical protein
MEADFVGRAGFFSIAARPRLALANVGMEASSGRCRGVALIATVLVRTDVSAVTLCVTSTAPVLAADVVVDTSRKLERAATGKDHALLLPTPLSLDQPGKQVHLDVGLLGGLVVVKLEADGVWIICQHRLSLEIGPCQLAEKLGQRSQQTGVTEHASVDTHSRLGCALGLPSPEIDYVVKLGIRGERWLGKLGECLAIHGFSFSAAKITRAGALRLWRAGWRRHRCWC